jgi:hypothetical protein
MRRTLLAGIAVAAALALAGCGGDGGSDEEAAVEEVVRTYFTAFADGDGAKACGQLATQAQVRLVEGARANDCAEAMEAAARQPEVKPYVERFRDVEVLEVTIAGREATAKVRAIGQETTIPLAKESGTWKISGGDVAPGG